MYYIKFSNRVDYLSALALLDFLDDLPMRLMWGEGVSLYI